MYINLLNKLRGSIQAHGQATAGFRGRARARLNSRTEQRKLRAEAALVWFLKVNGANTVGENIHLQAPPPGGGARLLSRSENSTG